MFKNYLTIAVRNLLKNKTSSFVNLCGLSIALAFCILAFIYLRHELTYDQHFDNAENIYRVYRVDHISGGRIRKSADIAIPIGPAMEEEYPETQSQ